LVLCGSAWAERGGGAREPGLLACWMRGGKGAWDGFQQVTENKISLLAEGGDKAMITEGEEFNKSIRTGGKKQEGEVLEKGRGLRTIFFV